MVFDPLNLSFKDKEKKTTKKGKLKIKGKKMNLFRGIWNLPPPRIDR